MIDEVQLATSGEGRVSAGSVGVVAVGVVVDRGREERPKSCET